MKTKEKNEKETLKVEDIQKFIEKARNGRVRDDVERLKNEYNPRKHQIITNKVKYPDREVISEYEDEKGEKKAIKSLAPIVRVALPYQQKIVRLATTFLVGNPIKYINNNTDKENDAFFEAFKAVIKKNKMRFIDKDIVKTTKSLKECAVLWYFVDKPNNHYGFNSDFEIKCRILSPEIYRLYPIFDNNDDLIMFSREFKVNEVEVFETYTAERVVRFEKDKDRWKVASNTPNAIGKIPVNYYAQDEEEWALVQTHIERLEEIYSNIGESNDRFSFPILQIKGEVRGKISKDKTGRAFEMGENGELKFVEHPNANESLNNEIDRLERDVHDFTDTPNISFDKMQGLGNMLAGSSAEFIFLSAHLKAEESLAIFEPAMLRRISIIKSMLEICNPKFANKELDIEPVFTPYVINNKADVIRLLMEGNGNKAIFSQRYSMEQFGIENPDEMMKEIEEENTRRAEKNNELDYGL